MKGYMIKRNDGKYFTYTFDWSEDMRLSRIYISKKCADYGARTLNNCKVVPVEIKECEDE
jgi:hypothetical protein